MRNHDPATITPEIQEQLIDQLIQNPMMDDACVELDISPMAVKRARRDDPALDADIFDAQEVGAEKIEARAYARAMGLDEEQLMHNGKPVVRIDPNSGDTTYITKRIHSDRVLMAMLKASMPTKYGDKAEIVHKGQVGVLAVPEAMSEQAFSNLLNKARAEAKAEAEKFDDEGIDAVYGIGEDYTGDAGDDLDDLA